MVALNTGEEKIEIKIIFPQNLINSVIIMARMVLNAFFLVWSILSFIFLPSRGCLKTRSTAMLQKDTTIKQNVSFTKYTMTMMLKSSLLMKNSPGLNNQEDKMEIPLKVFFFGCI